jgi:hypothetical protein
MNPADKNRADRRSQERAERDRNRRLRRLAVVVVNNMAELDPTVTGATFISADGAVEFTDANLLRRGGRA